MGADPLVSGTGPASTMGTDPLVSGTGPASTMGTDPLVSGTGPASTMGTDPWVSGTGPASTMGTGPLISGTGPASTMGADPLISGTGPASTMGTGPGMSGTGPGFFPGTDPVISDGTEIGAATGVGSRGWSVTGATAASGGIVDAALSGEESTSGGEMGIGAGTTISRGIRCGRSAAAGYAPPDIADSKRLMASSEGCRRNSPSPRKGVGKSSGASPDASGSATRNGDAPPPKSNIIAPTVISPVSSP